MLKNGVLFIATCSLLLGLFEIGLRLATPFPVTESSNKQPHPELAYTLSPDLPDVDAAGFRNLRHGLDQADLAIIGDSHTYGVNVSADDNFPSILEAETGRKVYNFGVSSYGVYQYATLVDQAIAAKVEDIVIALYPANDLALNCEVLGTDYWQRQAAMRGITVPDCTDRSAEDTRPTGIAALKTLLARTATVQALLELVWKPLTGASAVSADAFFLFEQGQAVNKDRLRGHSRAAALDDDAVHRSFENSKALFESSRRATAEASIGLSIIMIPSKERVLLAWAERSGQPIDPAFAALVQNELALTEAYRDFFETTGIAYSDAGPPVLDAFMRVIAAGGAFYPQGNGHPFRDGYAAYADAAIDALSKGRRALDVTAAR